MQILRVLINKRIAFLVVINPPRAAKLSKAISQPFSNLLGGLPYITLEQRSFKRIYCLFKGWQPSSSPLPQTFDRLLRPLRIPEHRTADTDQIRLTVGQQLFGGLGLRHATRE